MIPISYEYKGDNVVHATPPSCSSDRWIPREHLPGARTWKAFRNLLPSNRRDLLRHCVEASLTKTEKSLVQLLHDPSATIIAVNGSAVAKLRGTYAWSLATTTHSLWSGYGTARGCPMSPRRANAYGKLSWMQFLYSYASFYGIHIRCTILHYSDDKTLSKQTTFTQQLTRTWEVQLPDFDVVAAVGSIQQTLRSIAPLMTETRFVKPNCSTAKRTKKKPLNYIETLKSQAESVAGSHLAMVPNLSRISPTIPWEQSHIYLISNNLPTTSNEQYILRWQWREIELKSYLCDRWRLTKNQMKAIDWQSLASARSSLSAGQKVFSTKLLIGWLATGSHLAKYTDAASTCLKCGEKEDTDHLMRCHHDCEEWPDWLSRFQEFLLSINTAPTIIMAMIYGVSHWLHTHWDTTKSVIQSPANFHVKSDQTQVGWGLFMRGILAEEWNHQQLEYLRSTETMKRYKATAVWSKKISLWLMNSAQQRWSERNALFHSKSDPTTGHVSQAEALAASQVQQIYDEGSGGDAVTMSMLDAPQEAVLQRPLKSIQNWIKSTALTVRKRATATTIHIEKTHRDIRSYWRTPPATPQQPPPERQLSSQSPSDLPLEAAIPPNNPAPATIGVVTTKPRRKHKAPRKRNPKTQPAKSSAAPKIAKNQPTLWTFGWRKSSDSNPVAALITPSTQEISISTPHSWTSQRIERAGGSSQSKVSRIRQDE